MTFSSTASIDWDAPGDVGDAGRELWTFTTKKIASNPLYEQNWWINSIEDQIREISRLSDGWDGYDAARIDELAVRQAQLLMPQLQEWPDSIVPTPSGTLLLEWEGFLGSASLELGRNNFGFYSLPRGGKPAFLAGDSQDLDAEEINFALAMLAGTPVPHSMESDNWDSGLEAWNKKDLHSSDG